MKKLWVYRITPDDADWERIRQRFNVIKYTTINGYSPAEIADEDADLLEETAKRGFLRVLDIPWEYKCNVYSPPTN